MREKCENRRRRLIAAIALAALAPAVGAQSATRGESRRLGVLSVGARASDFPNWQPLLGNLAMLGYKEGANLVLEWRFADDRSERLAELAKDLVRSRIDALVTIGTLATRALQRATNTVPIVTGAVGDPILGGFAKSLARPGGNVTGLSLGGTDIALLQVGLLRAVMPKLSRLAIVRGEGDWIEHEIVGPMSAAARQIGITPEPVVVGDIARLESVLRGLRGKDNGAAFVYHADRVEEAQLAQAAIRHKIPTMFADRRWVSGGGLMSYNMYHEDRMQRVAALLVKVFRGMDPANSPFELPTNSQFVLNRKTAAELGLAIPREILARADEVIE